MKINSASSVKPLQDMVLTSIITKEFSEDELIIENKAAEKSGDQAKMYFGEVLSMGPDSTGENHCPGLKIGDTAFFSQFAGHHVSTRENKMVKIIRGYDIMATIEDVNNITESNIVPTADRIIVSAFYREDTEDGLILEGDSIQDPTLADLDYGVILKIGPTCKTELKIGDKIAYNTYVGECLQKTPKKDVAEYRVLNELDALFTI
jgi:co-chaperonin GroES (HSP10)